MWESDEQVDETELMLDFERLSKKYFCDFFVLRSRPREKRWHVVSFDIMSSFNWDMIAAEVTIPTDYPLIRERSYDKFWTLRLGKKGKIPMPVSEFRIEAIDNLWLKSGWHLDLYRRFCGLVPPDSYKGHVIYPDLGPYLVQYNTHHVGKKHG